MQVFTFQLQVVYESFNEFDKREYVYKHRKYRNSCQMSVWVVNNINIIAYYLVFCSLLLLGLDCSVSAVLRAGSGLLKH